MSHAAEKTQAEASTVKGVGSGDSFASERAAHAWVKQLDQMNNEQLADVLGFIFCKLCKR